MAVASLGLDQPSDTAPQVAEVPVVEVDEVHRTFGAVQALRGVDLEVAGGEVHALLGANGAGKTTLMRILCGLLEPSDGSAYVLGRRAGRSRELRALIGFVPSGDRSFYLRLSGFENLFFFARLHGLRRHAARDRAVTLLEAVGLDDAGRRPVSSYSHGMQKRLSFARSLLNDPPVLLVDEATHDLDPVAARQVRNLTLEQARAGAAVVWATQRIEELTGFAHRVTVLDRGAVAFEGSVTALAAQGGADRHVLELGPATRATVTALDCALGDRGRLQPLGDQALLTLAPGASLGTALAALVAAGADVQSCRDEKPPIERAFLAVTKRQA